MRVPEPGVEIINLNLYEPTVEDTSNNATQPQSFNENATVVGDTAYQSAFLKHTLVTGYNAKYEPTPSPGPSQSNPAPVPVEDVDKKADELIGKYTSETLWIESLDEEGLGKELAGIAKTDPERGVALTDKVFGKLDGRDKDDVAKHMVEAMTPDELRKFASAGNGREVLVKLKDHLEAGWTFDGEDAAIDRIEFAIKVSDFEKSAEFQKISPEGQKAALDLIAKNEKNNALLDNVMTLVKTKGFAGIPASRQAALLKDNGSVDNIMPLVKTEGFADIPADKQAAILGDDEAVKNVMSVIKLETFGGLPVETRRAILSALGSRPKDITFNRAISSLVQHNSFTGLTGSQQAGVINDWDKFANTNSYKNAPNDNYRAVLLQTIANVSIYSAQNPGKVAVRNTLNHLVNGNINIAAFSAPARRDGAGRIVAIAFGFADGNTINLNVHPDAEQAGLSGLINTTVHEVNHILNKHTEPGTADRFLDEYRAFYVGTESVGPVTPQALSDRIQEELVGENSVYPHLRELYLKDENFRRVIDGVLTELNGNPPKIVTPEQLRQRLVGAGFNTEYLKTPGNLDNR